MWFATVATGSASSRYLIYGKLEQTYTQGAVKQQLSQGQPSDWESPQTWYKLVKCSSQVTKYSHHSWYDHSIYTSTLTHGLYQYQFPRHLYILNFIKMMYFYIDWLSIFFSLTNNRSNLVSELRPNRLLPPSLSVVGSQPERRRSVRMGTWHSNPASIGNWRIQRLPRR